MPRECYTQSNILTIFIVKAFIHTLACFLALLKKQGSFAFILAVLPVLKQIIVVFANFILDFFRVEHSISCLLRVIFGFGFWNSFTRFIVSCCWNVAAHSFQVTFQRLMADFVVQIDGSRCSRIVFRFIVVASMPGSTKIWRFELLILLFTTWIILKLCWSEIQNPMFYCIDSWKYRRFIWTYPAVMVIVSAEM